MPDIKQVLSEEIRRLAKKELKAAIVPLQSQIAALKKTVAEQSRRLQALERCCPAAEPAAPAVKKAAPEAAAEAKVPRITAERIVKLRQKLGLTQAQFAALLGVNQFTASRWELGRNRPREAQKRKICALRDMGKIELKKLMAETFKSEAPAAQ